MLRYDRQRRVAPGTSFIAAMCLLTVLAGFGILKAHLAQKSSSASGGLLRRTIWTLDDDNSECRQVHHAPDQCHWIKTYCEDDDVGLLSYLVLYYCRLPHLKAVGFLIITSWTSLLFSTIGIAASDFFCINLSTISNLLGMSESMAGVTFLAFGNGSPDVFSTFAAIRTNSGSLAVGELIGAAGFITAVVAGSMALVRPFKVARRSFVRDVGFFIVAIAFSMVFVANGSLELWECAAMVAFYIFYVVIVVVWHWWLAQRRKRREQQAIARGYYVDDEAEGEVDFEADYHDDEQPRRRRSTFDTHATAADLHNLDRAENEQEDFDELEQETERDKWMGELSSNMRIGRTPRGERRNTYNAIRPSLVGALEFQSVLHSLRKSTNIQAPPLHMRRFSDDPALRLAAEPAKAHSTTSDPVSSGRASVASTAGTPDNLSEAGDTNRLNNPQDVNGRGRAKSANAADLLGLSPTTWHRRKRSRSNLSSPRLESRQGSAHSNSKNLEVPGQHQNESFPKPLDLPSPIVRVEPPPDELWPVQPSPITRPRAGTADLLAPPSYHTRPPPETESKPTMPDDTQSGERPSRPQLRITPPTPGPELEQFPFPSPRSRSSSGSSPAAQQILSAGIIPSPDSMYPTYSQPFDPPRPWRWWPYKIFVPPEIVLRTLFPTIHSWHQKTLLGKITGLVSVPSFFLLTITLPVVEPQAADSDSDDETAFEPGASNGKPSASGLAPPRASGNPGPDDLAQVAVSTEARQQHQHTTPSSHPHRSSIPLPAPESHPHAAVSSSREWNRWLVMIQCFTSPYFVMLAIWANFLDADPTLLFMPSLYTILGSTIAFLAILFTTRSDRPPRWHFLLCFAGFAVSITWISSIANEVVGVLKAIGVIFDISDAILGLTIFAVGNSMGDLVADITVARLGYPVMALSACFGGPMLNILLGIGLSGCYMVIQKADHRHHKHPHEHLQFKPYKVEVSTTLMVSAAALLVTLCGLLIVVPLNKWTMDRRIGWGLIGLWVLSTAGNLGVELSGIGKAYG